MRVYYPEDDGKKIWERQHLVASLTIHLTSKVNRFVIDDSSDSTRLFRQKEGVVIADTSIILPPSDFWGSESYQKYGKQ
jgi:hypothetical protein